METAVVWGWLLTMQLPGLPAIIDPNFGAKEGERCWDVTEELKVAFKPPWSIACTPTYKPEKARKPKRKKR